MATTYSLALTGRSADSEFAVKNVLLPDNAGLPGGFQGNASSGAQLLCKKPDGSQAWFTIDAERSTPSSIVLKAVSP